MPVQNPIALQALTEARKKTINDRRSCEKFVLRASPELIKAISELAAKHKRSVNGEICFAIRKSWVSSHEFTLYRAGLINLIGTERAERALGAVQRFPLDKARSPGRRAPDSQFIIRLDPGMREQLWARGDRSHSINSRLLSALVAWVNLHRELQQLVLAAEEPGRL